jgi:hypothetical protein
LREVGQMVFSKKNNMNPSYLQLQTEYDAKLAELDRLIAENNAKLAEQHRLMSEAIADAQSAIATAIEKLSK